MSNQEERKKEVRGASTTEPFDWGVRRKRRGKSRNASQLGDKQRHKITVKQDLRTGPGGGGGKGAPKAGAKNTGYLKDKKEDWEEKNIMGHRVKAQKS